MKKKAAEPAAKVQIKEKTNAQKTLRRFFSRKIAVAGMIILCSIILLALLGDFICPYDPAKIDHAGNGDLSGKEAPERLLRIGLFLDLHLRSRRSSFLLHAQSSFPTRGSMNP